MSEKCRTQKNTGMGLQDAKGTEGGIWMEEVGTERNSFGVLRQKLGALVFQKERKEKESKTQELRGFQPVIRKEYLECLLVASLQTEDGMLLPSLLRPLIFLHSCLREGTIKQPLKVLPCGRQLISSLVLLLLLRQNMTLRSLLPGPLSFFCLQKNFSQRISLSGFYFFFLFWFFFFFFSLTTFSTCNGSAEF